MSQFFVPQSWDRNEDTIKFKTIRSNRIDGSQEKNTKTKKLSKTKVKKNNKNLTNGPLEKKQNKNTKVKSGRIEKSKKQKKDMKLKTVSSNLLQEAVNTVTLPANSQHIIQSTSLESKLKQELMGGRFRYINEQLYTMNSKKANQLFKEDQDAFIAYHEGYRHQVKKWPLNPLDRIIKMIKRLPKSLTIGDFGCGDGRLAKEVPHKVYSMDLVSMRDDIIACDMANTPLQSGTLDVAVYCLSLMGTNLKEYLLEANRLLKLHGFVYIAEIQSRFTNVKEFMRGLQACGFELIKKDTGANFFYFFQLKKMRNVGKVATIPDFTLSPCLYRKR